jgi:hypothetical protein
LHWIHCFPCFNFCFTSAKPDGRLTALHSAGGLANMGAVFGGFWEWVDFCTF